MKTKTAKKAAAEPKSVVLDYVKSTAGTHVYGTDEREGVVCKQVYLLKSELPEEPPQRITLTVTWE